MGFDVLSSQQDIQRSYLLEASAGTGKTFAIENLVLRFLLEESPKSIDQILVVTFTRAATRDLKNRIRQNIEKALSLFQDPTDKMIPGYLRGWLEDSEKAFYAEKRLEQALFCFDQAQIFTIHGFCARMLREHLFEGDLSLEAETEKGNSDEELLNIIRDYFRTQLVTPNFSQAQLKIILEEYKFDTDLLQREILNYLKTKGQIDALPTFEESYAQFCQKMRELKKNEWKAEKILADFCLQASSYEGLCDRRRQVKSEYVEKVKRFANLFDQESWSIDNFEQLLIDGICLLEFLAPDKRRKELPELQYPQLFNILRSELFPIVNNTAHPKAILIRMVEGCQKLLKNYSVQNEKISFDDLIERLWQSIQNESFAEAIRQKFQIVIIDEFQDTDPLQWKIFEKLFLLRKIVYLVGDPKQSIYAFRQADIYTYLRAAEALGKENHASLDTNYRSQPNLVNALNKLFSRADRLFPLPKINQYLTYREVKSNKGIEKSFSDNIGSIHFFTAQNDESTNLEHYEETQFFPFIVSELKKLNRIGNIPLNNCAVLVSDRFQAQRLASYCRARGIESISMRSKSINDSPAVEAIREVLQATVNPSSESLVKASLCGQIFAWPHERIFTLKDQTFFESIISEFYVLRKILFEKGIGSFFSYLENQAFSGIFGETIRSNLLRRPAALEFYDELKQVCNALVEFENANNAKPEELIIFLDEISLQKRQLSHFQISVKDAVQILTLHASKGLEFDVVFALGLVTRPKTPFELIPQIMQGQLKLKLELDEDSEQYLKHCEEIDAEKMRQLYVATTRAKYRLYLPVINYETEPKKGCASPLELFLKRFNEGMLPSQLFEEDGNITVATLNETEIASTDSPESEKVNLIKPKEVSLKFPQKTLESFSSLSKNVTVDLGLATPKDFENPIKSPHTLPSGRTAGNLLHQMLEQLFKQSSKVNTLDQMVAWVQPYVRATPFEKWDNVIAEMLWNVLNAQLPFDDRPLSLFSIENSYQEMEFVFSAQDFSFEIKPSFLKGVIDLVFGWEDKFYIIDWKSNWLGPNRESYSHHLLQQTMQAHDYFLQAHIYKEALKRYLSLIDQRPFNEIFGGTFYIFLRGLTPETTDSIYKIEYASRRTIFNRIRG